MTTHDEPVEPGAVDLRGPMVGAPRSRSTCRGVGRVARALVGLLLAGVAVALLTACGPPPPPCATNWVGPTGGDFNVAASWDTGTVPGPATVACAPAGSSIVVSDPRGVANAQLGGSVTITTTGSLSIDQSPSSIGVLTLQGNLTGNAAVTVGQLDWSAGRMLGAGTTTVVGPTTVTNGVGTPKLANTRNLNLAGPTTWAASVARMCDNAQLTVSGPVTLTAPSALLSDAGCGASATAHLVITPQGTLTLTSPTTIVAPTVNGGTVHIDPATTASFTGGFSQSQGTLDLSATDAIARIGTGGGTLSASGGTITGTGRIEGTVTGGATLAPGPTWGTHIGTLTITGAYSPGPGGQLALDLAGPTPDTQADQVLVGQDATITGTTIAVTYAAGFTPTPGQTFTPITAAGALTGPVSDITTTGGAGSGLHALYAAHTLTLAVDQCDPTTFHPGADLMDADLTSKDLRGCALVRADLGSAHAPGADLTDADLRNTSLIATDLTGADLTGADLTGALTSATTLTGAVFADTTCPDGTNSDAHGGTCAANLLSATFTVNAGIDAVDANPGDHLCQTTTPGQCTLRAAIQEANASPGVDRVQFTSSVHTVAVDRSGDDDTGVLGDLDIAESVIIEGQTTSIEPSGIDRVFDIMPTASVLLTGVGSYGSTTVAGARNQGNLRAVWVSFWIQGAPGLVNTGNLEALQLGASTSGTPALDNAGSAVFHEPERNQFVGTPAVRNTGKLRGGGAYFHGDVATGSIGLDNRGTATLSDGGITTSDPTGTAIDNQGDLHLTSTLVVGGMQAVHSTGPLNLSSVILSTKSAAGTGIVSSADAQVDNIQLTGGAIGIASTGPLAVTASSISNASDAGIDTSGPTTIASSSIDGAGVGLRVTGATTVDRSTVSNSRSTGSGAAAIVSSGDQADLTVTSSTVAENASDGITITGGSALVSSSTVAGNSGHAVAVQGGALTATASLLGAPTGTGVCTSAIGSTGWNAASDATCALAAGSDVQAVDLQLGRLVADTGPTKTLLPRFGSPAIDAGPPTCPSTDQRGSVRPVDGDNDTVARCDRGSVEVATYHPLTLTVASTDDVVDETPGDGVCATAAPARCTLRAAITEANASFGPDTVILAPDTSYVASGLPTISTPLVIHGNGSGITTTLAPELVVTGNIDVAIDHLDGGEAARNSLMVTDPLASVVLTDSVIRVKSSAGGLTSSGTLTVDRVRSIGAGLSNSGTATVRHSSFAAAPIGVQTRAGATTTLERTTVNGSGLMVSSTGVENAGTTSLRDVTVTATLGAGLRNISGTMTARNTIVAEQAPGATDCVGSVTSLGWNLTSDATCAFSTTHDLSGAPASLGRIPTGAAVWFQSPQPGSPAIDSGDPACTTTDARGAAAPVDGTGDSVAACDRGAVEVPVPSTASFTATTTSDGVDASPGDGVCATVTGACTLRAAVDEGTATNGPVSVSLRAGDTYVLAKSATNDPYGSLGELRPSSPFTIHGQGASIVHETFTYNPLVENAGRSALAMDQVVIAGAIRSAVGPLELDDVTATGLDAGASLTAATSRIRPDPITIRPGATAAFDGVAGVAITNQGQLQVIGSSGTVLTTSGTAAHTTAESSTFATVVSVAGTTELTNSTISGAATALDATQGPITIAGSILAHSATGQDCLGAVTSGGWNLATDLTCSLTSVGDLVNPDPGLAPGAQTASGVLVRRPLLSSPAIDSGTGCTTRDATGTPRPADGDGDGTAICDRGAVELGSPLGLSLTVTTDRDDVDARPGDHVCETATPGQCSLRAAIMEADATNGADTIDLQPAVTYAMAPVTTDDDGGRLGDLDVTSPITLHGHGATIDVTTPAGPRFIDGFDVYGPVPVTVDSVTIRGAATGMRSRTGQLTLTDVGMSDVAQAVRSGGSLAADGFRCASSCSDGLELAGTSTIAHSTVIIPKDTARPHRAITNAGALTISASALAIEHFPDRAYVATDHGASLTLDQTTVTGGALDIAGSTVVVTSSTINADWTPILLNGGSATITNSILSNDNTTTRFAPGQPVCSGGSVVSGGWNVVTDASCNTTAPTDLVNADAGLDPFGNHGGPTATMPPSSHSVAVDSGKPGCSGTDQRGMPRPRDGDGNGSSACDRGAVELDTANPLHLAVNATVDAGDANPGDGVCQTAVVGQCTLRAALEEANRSTGADTIDLPANAAMAVGPERLPVHSDVTIFGHGSTIDGALASQGFDLGLSTRATMTDLVVVGAGDTTGQPVLLVPIHGELTLTRATVRSSRSDVIWNYGVVTIADSTFVDNVAFFSLLLKNVGVANISGTVMDHNAGGIENHLQLTVTASTMSRQGAYGPIDSWQGTSTTIRRSTFSGNAAGVTVRGNGQMWVYDSTITGNTGFGLNIHPGAVAAVLNSIVADQATGPNCQGTGLFSGGYNLSSDATCGFVAATDLVNTHAGLGVLADNGGLTKTHRPNLGSPAINSGQPGCGPIDQRGVSRPQGGACDRGSVER